MRIVAEGDGEKRAALLPIAAAQTVILYGVGLKNIEL